jgi:large subunit ribosomal protein L28
VWASSGGACALLGQPVPPLTNVKEARPVSAVCQVLGTKPGFGNSISHSHVRTRRRFNPNIQRKTYWVPTLRRRVTLHVSTKGIKTIDRRGIDVVVAEILARGVKV